LAACGGQATRQSRSKRRCNQPPARKKMWRIPPYRIHFLFDIA
jgi:hypothetical protein